MNQPFETEAQGRKRIREAEDERESKIQKLNHESQNDSFSGLRTFLHHVTAPLGDDIVPTTCSEAVGHEDKPSALILASPCLPQGSVCRAASGSKDEAIYIPIYIPSDSESESDGEADDTAPSFRERNTLIDKETTRQPNSPSPAPTLSTIPNTPRAMPPGFEIDGDFGDVQHSSPPSLVTSASVRGRERTGLAERKDECKSTTKMVDNDNPPDFPHSHDATACSNIVVGYDEKTVVPDSTAVSEYDADNSDARTDDVFSHTTRRIYNETREVRERDDMLYDKLDDVERMIASVTSTLSRTNDRLQAMHTKFDDRLEAMHTEILERFDALHEEIASLSAQQEQDDN
ncbi:hypothetical protein IF2G_10754 [Cordyceps javanica]|nr:hypothetical protein IF2G_10754 [Cordyceps javanica]